MESIVLTSILHLYLKLTTYLYLYFKIKNQILDQIGPSGVISTNSDTLLFYSIYSF